MLLHGFGDICALTAKAGPANLGRFTHTTSKGGVAIDVGTRPGSDPSLPYSLVAPILIDTVRAVTEGDASRGCAPHGAIDTDGDGVADTFTAVAPGTSLCFEVAPKSAPEAILCEGAGPLVFEAYVDVMEAGVARERHAIVVLERHDGCGRIC